MTSHLLLVAETFHHYDAFMVRVGVRMVAPQPTANGGKLCKPLFA
jgi:hypothetical protein